MLNSLDDCRDPTPLPCPQQQQQQQQQPTPPNVEVRSGDTEDCPSSMDCDSAASLIALNIVDSIHTAPSPDYILNQTDEALGNCCETPDSPEPPIQAQEDNAPVYITTQQQYLAPIHLLSAYNYDDMAMDVDSESGYVNPFDAVCAALPDPDAVCLASFKQELIKASKLETVHILAAPEDCSQPSPSMQCLLNEFFIPAEPSTWLGFQRSKYDRWAALHPSCRQATLRLLPQTNGCRASAKTCLTQCSACIRRVGGITCRFVSVRYISELKIETIDGTISTRYLLCPVFRSECEKAPSIRINATPIALPGRYVTGGDNGWIEFHVMCMTVSAIKSLLRFELAVVRDVQIGDVSHTSNGTIAFSDAAAPRTPDESSMSDLAVHPLWKCAPIPCIMRNIPSGPYQNCDECLAPIFSTFFSCCLCMRNLCPECFTSWDDFGVTLRYLTIEKGAGGSADKGARGQSISCCQQHTRNERGKVVIDRSFHKKSQFLRVSYYSEDELELMMRKANRIVRYCDVLDETQRAGYSSVSLCANELQLDDPNQSEDMSWPNEELDLVDNDAHIIASLGDVDFGADPTLRPSAPETIFGSETAGAGPSHSQTNHLEAAWDEKLEMLLQSTRGPLNPWQAPPVYVSADNLTLREFSRLWEEGWVVVVTGLVTEQLQEIWTPESLQHILGELCVSVSKAESRLATMGDWSLGQFLQLFGGQELVYSSNGDGDGDGKGDKWSDCKEKLRSMRLCALAKLKQNVCQEGQQSQSELTNIDEEPPSKRMRTKASGTPTRAPPTKRKGKGVAAAVNPAGEVQYLLLEQMLCSAAASLPFQEYVARDGQLNMVNRLPAQYKRPDFDPELHIMYGTQNDGSRENMRCETADFVNLMLYASTEAQALPPPLSSSKQCGSTATPRKKRAAKAATRGRPAASAKLNKTYTEDVDEPVQHPTEWDIYPANALDILCEYFGVDEQEANGSNKRNVIYRQSKFMDSSGCSELFEMYGYDARCCRVYQQPGDAVFVPLGCMFQRRTFANTISVQSRFMSPEHIADTRQVSGRLNTTKHLKRKEYSLPVMDILWWTWMGQQ